MDKRPILLVEDNEDDEAFALRAFRKNGVTNEVIVARDGQAALDCLFDTSASLPAFVLLDLKLPKVSGLDVLKRVREEERTKFVPLIMLTSSTHDVDMRESYGAGANSYLCKSLDIDEFTRDIGVLADYWLRMNKAID